ncbi:hypothetical protein Lal_00012897 [Lupinus albus]|uniref:Putative transcription factor MADS-type1 family n=1 Tax=Lupinus albus TaxID=3870 RepID=A0A6A4R0P0_LUPAL|nr:putative transcription factor MADS-type1 family [Lupinus albus]KAF1878172.1 hypothetical protein Lal_00012897 [Lupinus albus]
MTRKKVKVAYINDVNARKATFRKRKKGIMKKVNELTILCGIQGCAIIHNPFDSQTEVWPNPKGAKKVVERYLNTSKVDETKNMNQKSFFIQRISKSQDKLKKLRSENHEKEMTLAMLEYLQARRLPENLTLTDLKEMDKLIEQYMKEIENLMDTLC